MELYLNAVRAGDSALLLDLPSLAVLFAAKLSRDGRVSPPDASRRAFVEDL